MSVRTARDLGAAIKHARKVRSIAQTTLAKAVGVHQPKISAVERGAPGVRIGLILQILRALDLAVTIDATAAPPDSAGTKRPHGEDDDHVDLDKIANTGLD